VLLAVVGGAAAGHAASELPPELRAELQRARIPAEALHVVVHELSARGDGAGLAWQHQQPVNPASLAKLLTTAAALDQLGPAWAWSTPVWLAGTVKDGVLEGTLHLQGSGDPGLVLERLWLLLRRVMARGVREIRGDIVLDSSAFDIPEGSAADFDGEPLRAYNVRPDALLLNQHVLRFGFVPDLAAGVARVSVEPPLAGTVVVATVPLVDGPCGDWRRRLGIGFGSAGLVRFAGSYATACGDLVWNVADPLPASYNARLVEALWRELGGTLSGQVRSGPAPATPPSFSFASQPLAEVVRDINKFSNNVMAQQLFLSLPAQAGPARPVTPDMARDHLRAWLETRLGAEALADGALVVDNGSGLSRSGRITAQLLARLLTQAWDSPTMPELMSSLPIGGVDGTLRRSRATPGRAHLKTGSLRDVNGIAGYVLSHSGRRYVLVAIVNHANAGAARPALDALVQWTLRDLPVR
jgi:D-alanyl-D-alanine carboxypeptidase/D-alanyl-D-alanine-endopeptidase (penicillin-binding protein 4)